jgi:dTDP-4-amino-4,6-dideoxygalactose transaminase
MGALAVTGGEKTRTRPFPAWPTFGEREEKALIGVLRSGQWGMGKQIDAFEKAFGAYQDAEHCIAVTTGTAALEVALKSCGVKPGHEVIVPPYTFIATASAVVHVGGIPVFVDVEPDTFNLDPAKVEAAITRQTKAIIAVHIGGRPADLDGVVAVGRRHGLRVIEDACQSHGAIWKGQKVGGIADIGAFSFQSSKNLNAGEGGAVVTNDRELGERAWSYHNCGRVKTGAWYEHHVLGSNHRITEFQAALLLAQMENLEAQTQTRQANGDYLTKLLTEVDGIEVLRQDERVTRNAYHLYIFRYKPEAFGGLPKKKFLEALSAEGVPCSSGYVPLYRERAFTASRDDIPFDSAFYGGKVDYAKVSCPVTERVCADEAIWLTQRMLLGSKEDMEDIARAVRKVRVNCAELKA